ncbi:MAG TPA: fibronectin type III domain-containing protein, partial [Vicinamibacterales bacterium]|nr:fibronectin type III domain-containing protein [Vicinamibacterales bacterium]
QAILDSAVGTPTSSIATLTATGGRLNISLFLSQPPPPPPLPAAPSGLSASAASSSQINLSWTDQSNNEDGFRIERCTGSGCTSFAAIGTVGVNVTTFQNTTGLAAGTTYAYRVVAFNGGGSSNPSNVAQATTLAAPSVPAAPSSLTATAVSSSQVNLSWADNSSNETSFRIERCTGATCTAFSEIASVGSNVTAYQNATGLVAGTTYRYRVIAANGTGPSTPSNIAIATTTAAATGIPAVPTGLVATAGPGVGQITLTWNDNSTNEIGFRLYRCGPSGCVDAPAGSVTANTTTFVNSGLLSGASYSYTVRAYNASGYSGASNSAGAVAP